MADQNWPARASNFAERHNLKHPVMVHTLDLASEVGEVAKEVLQASDYGRQTPHFNPANIGGELGDVLFSLCLLASATGVDLEVALETTLEKYERRWREKGHTGSSKE